MCLFDSHDMGDALSYSIWNSWYLQNPNILKQKNKLIQNGCCYIRDLMNGVQFFLSYNEFIQKFNININQLDFQGLIQSIPKKFKRSIHGMDNMPTESSFSTLIKGTGTNKKVYSKLIKDDTKIKEKNLKWENKLNITLPEREQLVICTIPYNVTTDTKSRALQYKIVNHIIVTNKYLKTCQIKTSALCTFCQLSDESILHLFWACPKIQTFWQNVNVCLQQYIDLSRYINAHNVLLGIYNDTNVDFLNLILIITKRYIYA